MEFNLGRAMAITQRLREEFNLVSTKTKRAYSKSQNVNMLSGDLINRFEKDVAIQGAQAQLMFKEAQVLLSLIYRFRAAIAKGNADSGVSALLAQNEEFAEKAAFYQSLMVLEPLNVAEELEKMHSVSDKLREQDIASKTFMHIVTVEDNQAFGQLLSEAKKERNRCKDKIAELNATFKIDIQLSEDEAKIIDRLS
jgi:hypothetical protein